MDARFRCSTFSMTINLQYDYKKFCCARQSPSIQIQRRIFYYNGLTFWLLDYHIPLVPKTAMPSNGSLTFAAA